MNPAAYIGPRRNSSADHWSQKHSSAHFIILSMADQAALPSIFLINNVVQSRSPGRGALKSAPRPDVNVVTIAGLSGLIGACVEINGYSG